MLTRDQWIQVIFWIVLAIIIIVIVIKIIEAIETFFEEYLWVIFVVFIGLGIINGITLGHNFLYKFLGRNIKRTKKAKKIVSAILGTIFLINIIDKISKFTNKEPLEEANNAIPNSFEEFSDMIFGLVGLDNVLGWISIGVMVITIIIYLAAKLEGWPKKLAMGGTMITLIPTVLVFLTPYEPGITEIMLVSSYQLSFVLGIFLGAGGTEYI